MHTCSISMHEYEWANYIWVFKDILFSQINVRIKSATWNNFIKSFIWGLQTFTKTKMKEWMNPSICD